MKNGILSLAAAAVLAAPLAHARTVTYDLTVNGGSTGPLANVTSSGYITFDSEIIPAGGGTLVDTGLLSGLSLQWDGFSYDQTTANTGWLSFDASGALTGEGFGAFCSPGTCTVFSTVPDWFVAAAHIGNGPVTCPCGGFVYATGDGQLYDGSANMNEVAAAPEIDPATAASGLTLLLGALAVLRRRHRLR